MCPDQRIALHQSPRPRMAVSSSVVHPAAMVAHPSSTGHVVAAWPAHDTQSTPSVREKRLYHVALAGNLIDLTEKKFY